MKKIASGRTLVLGVICFIVFLVAACGLYYGQNQVFPSGRLVAVYAVLGALGSVAIGALATALLVARRRAGRR